MPAGARRWSGKKKGWPARQHNSSIPVSARQLQAHVRLQHVASTLLRFWGSERVAPVLLLLNYLESKALMLYPERAECAIQGHSSRASAVRVEENDGISLVTWVDANACGPRPEGTPSPREPLHFRSAPLDALRNDDRSIGEARLLDVALSSHEILGATNSVHISGFRGLACHSATPEGVGRVCLSARLGQGGSGERQNENCDATPMR